MLRCRDVFDLLDDYLDGALEGADATALTMHLQGCEACTAFFETYRGTVRATRSLRDGDLPPQLRERLLSFLSQRQPH